MSYKHIIVLTRFSLWTAEQQQDSRTAGTAGQQGTGDRQWTGRDRYGQAYKYNSTRGIHVLETVKGWGATNEFENIVQNAIPDKHMESAAGGASWCEKEAKAILEKYFTTVEAARDTIMGGAYHGRKIPGTEKVLNGRKIPGTERVDHSKYREVRPFAPKYR